MKVNLKEIQSETEERHLNAFKNNFEYDNVLNIGGDLSFRLNGENHVWTPETIGMLQHAVRSADYSIFKNILIRLTIKQKILKVSEVYSSLKI